jgi:thioredoxin reductase (NADPH)
MSQPIFYLVVENAATLDALREDLLRRFAADYRVLGATSAATGLDELRTLAGEGERVALVIADQEVTELGPVTFLVRARQLHPAARRVLMIRRGNWSAAHPAVAAMECGQIDFYLFNPWRPLEQILYPSMSDFLRAWNRTQEAQFAAFRIVDRARSPRAYEVRDLLSRVTVPYWFYEDDSPAGQRLLAEVGADGSRLPVLVAQSGIVLVDPSHEELAVTLGMRTRPELDSYDVAVVGAGPAGLGAAVYAASEGLETLVLEPVMPGGQAGTSSLIRNYLGFQHGVSGDELASRAAEQAWLFGAHLVMTQAATALRADGARRVLRISDGSEVSARTVIIATGVSWRRLGMPALEALVGAGVFYGAAATEARAMRGRDVFVIGAGNSAGQAAVHLAEYARSVTMLVRGASLHATMSEYLVTVIAQTPNIRVQLATEVVGGDGDGYLEALTIRDRNTGRVERLPASGLFVLIGAEPRTEWLDGTLQRSEHGYLLTGRDVAVADDRSGHPRRAPMPLETSVPAVFAVGDVRYRSIKRVASAVGEGATAIHLVHEYLSETA